MVKEYPSHEAQFWLGKWGGIHFRQWFFPGAVPTEMTEKTIDDMALLVPPGSFAIDIGAWIGDTTIPMALAAGKEGYVLAFEPGKAAMEFLQSNLVANNLGNVEVLGTAVMTEEGCYDFNYTDEGLINGGYSLSLDIGPAGCGNPVHQTVFGISLTGYLFQHYEKFRPWLKKLSFVKIDTEGFDRCIVESNAMLFRQCKPTIQVEVYPFLSQRERRALMQSILDIGYRWDGDEKTFVNENSFPTDVICRPKA